MATSILSTKALVDSCEEVEARGARAASNPRPGRTYECEDLCRRGFMLAFSTMGITVIMVGYLMLGAVMFSGLEGGGVGWPSEQGRRSQTGEHGWRGQTGTFKVIYKYDWRFVVGTRI